MVCWTVYAIIQNSEVQNVIVGEYYDCNQIAINNYGKDAFAVEVTQIPTQIGDKYENGEFSRYNPDSKSYELITRIPTNDEEIAKLKTENEELQTAHQDNEVAIATVFEMIIGGNS